MVAPSSPGNLPDYVLAAVQHVIELSGYPIMVEELEHLEFDSVVKFASAAAPCHEISYSPGYREFASHFILSSVEKLRRHFAVPVQERFMPCRVGSEHLPADEERELKRRMIRADPQILAAVSRQLHTGLVRQLTSYPLDARVELDLFADFPEHHEQQLAYLRRQLRDVEPHFSDEIEAFSPPKTYAAVSAMNCAFAEICAKMTGEGPMNAVRNSRHWETGRELVSLLDAVREPGHVGDRAATDAWASRLCLRARYEWVHVDL